MNSYEKCKSLVSKSRIILPKQIIRKHSSNHAYVYGTWIKEFGFNQVIVENDYFKLLFLGEVISPRTAKRKIKEMVESGLFDYSIADPKERKQLIVNNKDMKDKGVGIKTCNWCGYNCTKLHSHHYPIQKKDGGTETVDICPNCHAEYHSLKFKIKANDIYNVDGYLKEIKCDNYEQ